MITYNLRKPVKTNACNSVGVMGENNSFTAKFFIDKLVDSDLSFSIHLRFADGSVNTVVPDEVSVDDTGTTIIWNVKKNDIFVHGFFEMQIEGRKSNGYVFQTEIVRMYADESIPIEDKEYENPNSETLKLREEAYDFLCELKIQQDKLDENMKLLLATDITTKADNATVVSESEGLLSPSLCSKFFRGQVNSEGVISTTVKYRVTSEDIMKFDYDLNVTVDDGFTAYVVKYVDGEYNSIKSLPDTNGYTIQANTEFRLHIRKFNENGEEVTETADINEFVNAVKFQTKIAAEVALKADKAEVDASLALKADNCSLVLNSEGLSGFAPYGSFVRGNARSTDGTINKDTKYRVTSENIMQFDYDLNISVDDGFTAYVVKFENGTYVSIKSLSDTNGYVIPANTEFRLHIRRKTENTAETANISEFVSAVNFRTKIAAEVADVDSRVKVIEDKIDNIPDNNTIPDYYYADDYLPNKIKEIREASAIVHGVTFAFITDVHFKANQKQSKKLLRKVLDETNVPFVLCGGDIVYLVGTEEELYEQITDFNEFKSCIGKDRLFCTRGNHDLYNGERENLFDFGALADSLLTSVPGSFPVVNGILGAVDKSGGYLSFSSNGSDCYTRHLGETAYKISVMPKTSYSLSFKQEGSQGRVFVFFNGQTGTGNMVSTDSSGGKLLFTTNEDTTYITLRFGIAAGGTTATVSDIKLYKDDNVLTTADVYDTLFRDTETKVSSMSVDNGCYCIDNEPQKTRIIMLNTTDVSGNFDYKGGGVSFRSGTLQWLSAALTEKTDYKIIIVCHTPLNYETFANDVNFGENRDGLSLMVQAFKNKTEFETTRFETTVNADFRNNTNELICVISGHRHIDGNSVENNVLNIVTTCDCIDKKDGYGRKAGTISEQAFDVFCINYDTNKINAVRIGAGSNREIEF